MEEERGQCNHELEMQMHCQPPGASGEKARQIQIWIRTSRHARARRCESIPVPLKLGSGFTCKDQDGFSKMDTAGALFSHFLCNNSSAQFAIFPLGKCRLKMCHASKNREMIYGNRQSWCFCLLSWESLTGYKPRLHNINYSAIVNGFHIHTILNFCSLKWKGHLEPKCLTCYIMHVFSAPRVKKFKGA